MALFGLFGKNKKDEFRQFEKIFKRVWVGKGEIRRKDQRDAFLTPDLLRRRNEVTKSGRQRLVLDFGYKGGTVSYTLADLNRMAKAVGKTEGKYDEASRGVPVPQLLRSSLAIDVKRAREITNSTLYKFDGNLLLFRAKAQTDTRVGYHQVKVRLDEWEREIREGQGGNYLPAARNAARGRVSFDCDCGRHQYWYRYLATIGGFALDPKEFAFPKIKNPKLQGCCCKHVLKTLAVLQMPMLQGRIAKEMEAQAKKKGWYSRILKGDRPDESFMDEKELARLEKAGGADLVKALKGVRNLQKGLKEKIMDKVKAQVAEIVAKTEIKKRRELQTRIDTLEQEKERDILIARLRQTVDMATGFKIPVEQAVKKFADDNRMSVSEVQRIGKEAQIL